MFTNDKFYLVFGLALVLGLAVTHFRGWTFTSVDEVKKVPKSVRNNPGAYRSHYRTHVHYFGGK